MSPGAGLRLVRAVQGVRLHLGRIALAAALVAVVGAVGVVLLLGWLLAGPSGWEAGTGLPLLLLGSGLAATLLLLAWIRVRYLRWVGEPALAREVERVAGIPEGAVRAQLELARRAPEGVSKSLAEAGAARLLGPVTRPPSELAGRSGIEAARLLGGGGGAAAGVVLLVVLAAWASPDRSRAAWAGLANPVPLLWTDPLPPLRIDPGDATFPRGSRPEVSVHAPGRDSVWVHWTAVGDPPQEAGFPVAADGAAALRLPSLEGEATYWARARDGARTPRFRLTPRDPALLSGLGVELRFPPHTRRLPELHTPPPPHLRIPEGTTIRIEGRLAGEGTAVVLREAAGTPLLRASISAGRFTGVWRPLRSTRVEWEVEGSPEAGVLPPALEVEVVADLPPEIALTLSVGTVDLPLSLRLPFALEATDDHGVAWVEIEVIPHLPDGRTEAAVIERIATGDRVRVTLAPVLDVSDWGLLPGSELTLRARAEDNAPDPGRGETPSIRLRIPTRSELLGEVRERIEEGRARLEAISRESATESRELRELARRIALEAGADGFRAREELLSAVERLERTARRIDELAGRLDEASGALGGSSQERRLSDELDALTAALARAIDPGMRARMEALMTRAEQGDPGTARRAAEQLAESGEALLERLEETLESVARLALDQALLGAEEAARALAEEQERSAERLGEGVGIEEQEALAGQTGTLERQVEALVGELARRDEVETVEIVRRAEVGVERALEAMGRALTAAGQGDPRGAAEEGQSAADGAREAGKALEEARERWAGAGESRLRDAWLAGAEDALALARLQEVVEEGIQGAGLTRRGELQAEVAAVREGTRNLATRLGPAIRQRPEVGRDLSIALGRALAAADRTLAALRPGFAGGTPTPRTAAVETGAALRRIALLALSALDASGEGGGDASDRWMEEMEGLAGDQGGLNRETRGLAEGMEGMSGEEARAGMEALAALQEGIAAAVAEAGARPGVGSETQPEAWAAEAEALARELAEGRLTPELLDRQQVLLDRLLDATRGIPRGGETERREGTAAAPRERSAVAPFPEELLRSLAVPVPTAEELRTLTPAERRLVLEYFDRLNRPGGGGRP